MISVLLTLLSAPPLTLDDAMDAAGRRTAGVIRAEADLLLVDVDKARALAQILPSVGVSMTAGESILGAPFIEARASCYRQSGSQACISPIAGGEYTLSYGPFYDAQTNQISAPTFTLGLSVRQLIFDGGR